ncbi:MAG: hypothetical protein HQK79_17970 [Desulfobacterales bacterium]|nr:hypothetical protein [Desulfobacterales bacterium]MBF0398385.1 hypothetical protein [Desulfobacterales bacterium]
MEEIFLGAILGGAVVFLSKSSEFFKGMVKGAIKSGYALTEAVASHGSETIEKLKDLVAESKIEFETSKEQKIAKDVEPQGESKA